MILLDPSERQRRCKLRKLTAAKKDYKLMWLLVTAVSFVFVFGAIMKVVS
ncbi:hypothetical protein SAMN05444144_10682 [Flavobacterium akiainvivens]|nr:hypothetical protein SAMN05444144_10682 [Flavobacterium akiainvivens]